MQVRLSYYRVNSECDSIGNPIVRDSKFFKQNQTIDFMDSFVISPANDKYYLQAKGDCSISLAGTILRPGKNEIVNGQIFTDGEYNYKFNIEFNKVGFSPVMRYTSIVTASIVLIILFVEIFVVSWLPEQLQSAMHYTKEQRRQVCSKNLDRLNSVLKSVKVDGSFNNSAVALLRAELTTISKYYKKNQYLLSSDELQIILTDLTEYDAILSNIKADNYFKKEIEMDFESWLENNQKK